MIKRISLLLALLSLVAVPVRALNNDSIQRLATVTVSVSSTSPPFPGDGALLYTAEPGITRVTEFVIRPSADIPASSPLRFVFSFRPLAPFTNGGTVTNQLTPSFFNPLFGMGSEFGYVAKPNAGPFFAANGETYLGHAGAYWSLAIRTAHDQPGVNFTVDVIGYRIGEAGQ